MKLLKPLSLKKKLQLLAFWSVLFLYSIAMTAVLIMAISRVIPS